MHDKRGHAWPTVGAHGKGDHSKGRCMAKLACMGEECKREVHILLECFLVVDLKFERLCFFACSDEEMKRMAVTAI